MLRTRRRPSPGQVALAFVIFLVGAYLVRAATHTFYFQPDDELFRSISGYIVDRFPGSLFTLTPYERGIQRLHLWLLALPLAVTKGSTAFFLMHLIQVMGYVSAAVPAYL